MGLARQWHELRSASNSQLGLTATRCLRQQRRFQPAIARRNGRSVASRTWYVDRHGESQCLGTVEVEARENPSRLAASKARSRSSTAPSAGSKTFLKASATSRNTVTPATGKPSIGRSLWRSPQSSSLPIRLRGSRPKEARTNRYDIKDRTHAQQSHNSIG